MATNFYPSNGSVKVSLSDDFGNADLVRCTVANIPSAVAGYAVGCILKATDTGGIYTNTGSATSCTFTLLEDAGGAFTLPVTATYSSSSTSGSTSVESMSIATTMTGVGGVGGRFKSSLTTNVALGGWSNALKGEVTYGASGSTSGLGSAVVAEMTLSAGTVSGTYAPLEIELNMGSNAPTGTSTSLVYASVNGTATNFIDSGHLLNLQGLGAAAAGKIFQENTSGASHSLRILIGSTPYYLLLSDT